MGLIFKGKPHKKYEFGNQVSIVKAHGGAVVGAKGLENEYDGHMLGKALE
ncbi:MAG: hypothetical protein MUC97_07910 [Bernardetiaceae bacterium]|nr:hypothetical protein [Bernardetiaceae bacterium]